MAGRRQSADPTWGEEARRYLADVLLVAPEPAVPLAALALRRVGRRRTNRVLAPADLPRLHEALREESWFRQEHPARSARRADRLVGRTATDPKARRRGRLAWAGVALLGFGAVGGAVVVAKGEDGKAGPDPVAARGETTPEAGNPTASGRLLAETSTGEVAGRRGATVVLRRPDGEEVARATTVIGGEFELVAPAPGTYLLTVDMTPGFETVDGGTRAVVDVDLTRGSSDGIEVRMVRS